MPTYHEVLATDPAKLTAAADKWEALAGKFKKLEDQYEREVHSVAMGTTWTGLSAQAAKARFDVTLREYQAAQKEAKALASLLRGARTQLVDLRNRVKSLRDDAVKDGMRVSDQGVVSYDYDRLDDSARTALAHDPSYQQSVRSAVSEWDQAIRQAVKAVGDADDVLAAGLKSVVTDSNLLDGTMAGFNSAAHGDFKKHEAEEKARRAAKAAAEEAAEHKAEEDNAPAKGPVATLLRGVGSAVDGLKSPGDLGVKMVNGLVNGVAGATGYNSTQGISVSGSAGFGAGVGGEIALVRTRKPDGGEQWNLMVSGSSTTAGWDFGLSGNIGRVQSNADDISQLKGTGWDKGGSVHAGLGIWGNHQNAIGSTNSEGDPVKTASGGVGLGLGNEISTGFSQAEGWTILETKGKED
ncbi:hypothetical protein ACFQVC_13040 [Streptomyces monticola]|uniref:WXG100 family type VII secretion target n=1 Tax=Streptomyces monticola TaxID=2666263 RepID=A0ABW2JGF3_9ACTN